MKVLFLDIDGVVNCANTNFKTDHWPLDRYMAFLVGKIVLDTGCKVVLSSSWRNHPEGVLVVEKHITPIMDKTCQSWYIRETDHHSRRGEEIQKWLDEWEKGTLRYLVENNLPIPQVLNKEITRYCILDDDSDMLPHQKHFKTSWQVGLTDEIAKQVIEYLNA